MTRLTLRLFCAIAAVALAVVSAGQITVHRYPRFPRIFVFGDSLSDAGNVYQMTFHFYPAAPYWNGRFSNGPVWVEKLGNRYNLTLSASLTGGTDYAYGGAETGSGYSPDGTSNVGRQRSLFTSNVGQFNSTDLVVLWAGANDLLNGQTNVAVPTTNLYNECVALKNLGARYILIGNVPPLGYTPRYLGTANEGTMNTLTQSFNSALHSRVLSFRAAFPTVKIIEFDVASMFLAARAAPAIFGLSNISQSYMATNRTENPDTYMFWDDLHPTRAMHTHLGAAAYALFSPIVAIEASALLHSVVSN